MTGARRRCRERIFEVLRQEVRLLILTAVLLPVLAWPANAQTFYTLHSFTGGADGAYPSAGLVRDKAGNLFGTTVEGGTSYWGTVFKLSTAHKETVLHSFTGQRRDGASPWARLVPDAAGNLYSTTGLGGAFDLGTVFKLATTNKEKVLYSFSPGLGDGQGPSTSLVRDAAGNLYGTTPGGGVFGYGTVFKVTATGEETVLYNFAGGRADGFYPGSLVLDQAGNLYGTTCSGGSSGNGTVFKLDKTGRESLLYNFTGGPDGGCPMAALVGDRVGNLYGTTSQCQAYPCGTVFRLDKTGKETTLYGFTGGAPLLGRFDL
jgi:uncharacterized repeat protein (TIGR03803 family)